MAGQKERAAQILDRRVRTTYSVQAHTGQTVIRTYQDCQAHVDYAAACRAHERDTKGEFGRRKSSMQRKMVVPFNVLQQVVQSMGLPPASVFDPNVAEVVWKKLHGSDYKRLRTTNDKRIG